MKKIREVTVLLLFLLSFLMAGCRNKNAQEILGKQEEQFTVSEGKEKPTKAGQATKRDEATETGQAAGTAQPVESYHPDDQPVLVPVDYSAYFQGINGGAVIYVPNENRYMIYNEEVSAARRPPCSTFKIISSLTGLEHGVISKDNSIRKWSGEVFWNEKWNRDIDFRAAFQSSCVWYFREVIDELGQEAIQSELNRLYYGNCDIQDWEGRLNNNNSNPALTGFWIESSLKISPKEQVEVLERIFGDQSIYKEETLEVLKDAMLIMDSDSPGISLYGKTGLGKSNGVVRDAWFTGFAETEKGKAYFCVYLGETENRDFSSTDAKNIAIQLLKDNF